MAARLQGRVTNISDEDLGSSLDGDHAAGATTIVVQNAADFDEDGGTLVINDQQIVYTSCDDDTDTITLAEGLTAAAEDGDTVSVWDPLREVIAVDKMASVDVGDDYADDMEAVVALHLVGHLVEGPRGDDGESVVLELDEEDDEWKVVDILGLGAPEASGVQFDQDSHTVTAVGEQIFTLSHTPIKNSEHLYWNGIYQPAAQFTRDEATVTVPDAGGHLAVGDELVVEYAYRKGLDGGRAVLIDWQAGGWRYLQVADSDSVDRSGSGFDDAGWAVGTAAFGWAPTYLASDPPPPTTAWTPTTALWVRRAIDTASGASIEINVRVEADVDVYWNGDHIGYAGNAAGNSVRTGTITAFATGSDVLAFRVGDNGEAASAGGSSYFDAQVVKS